MKVEIISKGKEKKGQKEMPAQFCTAVRADVIKRAVEAEQANNRQPYGASPRAGLRHVAFVSKRRHDYKATYGIGQSRTPRKVTSRSGSRMNWVGAEAPQTVGGRRAHPPKADKIWTKKMNNKELALAMQSACSATILKDSVKNRGHVVPDSYPYVLDNSVEALAKTKEVVAFLQSIDLGEELKRVQDRHVRAGKGKMRGRKYKTKKGPLIVTAKECALSKAAPNIPGVDIKTVDKVTAHDLAPGAVPGRLTLWTESAVDRIKEENTFTK